MLAADKLQLQSALKQQATALKEKEFNLHASNYMTVGTQAAVLAGLDITMFIEFNPAHNDAWNMKLFPRILKFIYYVAIVSAFCCNMTVVAHTTALNVLGAGMALRGPDGSMMTATDGMYAERSTVFTTFGWGLACTVGSVVLCVWLILSWESAIVCMMISIYGCWKIWKNYQRAAQHFEFDESQTVDFRDIMEGPAAIQAIPWTSMSAYNGGNHRLQQQQKGAPKKAESMPLTLEDDGPYSDMDGPYSDMDARMNISSNRHVRSSNDIHKRRGPKSTASPVDGKDSFIQTV